MHNHANIRNLIYRQNIGIQREKWYICFLCKAGRRAVNPPRLGVVVYIIGNEEVMC